MASSSRPQAQTQIVRGIAFPIYFKPENIIAALELKVRDGDIFVATFPKCGTFWTQYIVWAIMHPTGPLPIPSELEDLAPFLEYKGSEYFIRSKKQTFILHLN